VEDACGRSRTLSAFPNPLGDSMRSLLQWYATRTVIWRPWSNLCDPQWLAADLLAAITDTPATEPYRPKNFCKLDLAGLTFRIEVFTEKSEESYDTEDFTLKGVLPAGGAKGIVQDVRLRMPGERWNWTVTTQRKYCERPKGGALSAELWLARQICRRQAAPLRLCTSI
jgi:hypothetical protein